MKPFLEIKQRLWQLVIVLCTVTLAVYLPLQVVTEIPDQHHYTFIYWLIIIIFFIDVIVNYVFPPSEFTDEKHLKQSRTAYLKSWFIIDMLAAIPFEFIFSNPVYGLIRLVKFVRVALFIHDIRRKSIKLQDYSLLIFFGFWLLMISHWFACIWIYLRSSPPFADPIETYIASIYWVIETLTTVGYGEIVPVSIVQQIYAILIMLFGVAMYGFIIGNVAGIITKRNPARAQYFQNLEALRTFVNYRKIPLELQKKIMNYYLYIWEKKLGFDESVFISELPQGLQYEVSVYLKREILWKIPLFREVSNSFLEEVSLHMRPIVSVPDEFIFKEGDIGNEMYFVIRGKLNVISGNKIITTLTDGDFFGEIALFNENKRRTAAVTSITYCDLYRLDRELFNEVLNRHPEIAEHIRTIANQRMVSDNQIST